ncbi:toprim domain-containing protein [bacterium]|jgi:twinkle protein|nr:toprim domain-containing protein [bacterium]
MSQELYKTECKKCGSSDGNAVYDDNHAYCYVCQHYTHDIGKENEVVSLAVNNSERNTSLHRASGLASRGCRDRGITKTVAEHFGVLCEYNSDGNICSYLYPYHRGSELVAYKVRELPKTFSAIGDFKGVGLFGQNVFPAGGKRIVITEGEFDAMAVATAYAEKGTIWPVVSVPNGATAKKTILEQREYLRSFDEVIVMYDNDEAGENGLEEAVKIIGYDKAKVTDLGKYKDPNEVLIEAGPQELLRMVWNARTYTPAGIVAGEEVWKQLEEYNEIESVPYPECLGGLNDKLKGMRRGEIALWTSGTGSGKSTILREIVAHLHQTTTSKIGVVALEESPAETARKLSGMMINRNPAKEEIPLEELRTGFDEILADGRINILDHNGSVGNNIIGLIEYLCASGCEYIFLDHITILVSEGAEGLTGNEAIDKIMNDLRSIVKKWNVWIGLVSHLRKMDTVGKSFEDGKIASLDDIRGSGSIKQVSYDIIAFARDVSAEDEDTRNTIQMKVLKSRYTGLTGPCGEVRYDYDTGRLNQIEGDFDTL